MCLLLAPPDALDMVTATRLASGYAPHHACNDSFASPRGCISSPRECHARYRNGSSETEPDAFRGSSLRRDSNIPRTAASERSCAILVVMAMTPSCLTCPIRSSHNHKGAAFPQYLHPGTKTIAPAPNCITWLSQDRALRIRPHLLARSTWAISNAPALQPKSVVSEFCFVMVPYDHRNMAVRVGVTAPFDVRNRVVEDFLVRRILLDISTFYPISFTTHGPTNMVTARASSERSAANAS